MCLLQLFGLVASAFLSREVQKPEKNDTLCKSIHTHTHLPSSFRPSPRFNLILLPETPCDCTTRETGTRTKEDRASLVVISRVVLGSLTRFLKHVLVSSMHLNKVVLIIQNKELTSYECDYAKDISGSYWLAALPKTNWSLFCNQLLNLIRPYIDLDFRDTGITKFESRIIVKQILKRNKGLRIPQKNWLV